MVVVQLHSAWLIASGVLLLGIWHVVVAVCGKGVAVRAKVAIICDGVNVLFTPSIKATVPETMGAEKLVPKL